MLLASKLLTIRFAAPTVREQWPSNSPWNASEHELEGASLVFEGPVGPRRPLPPPFPRTETAPRLLEALFAHYDHLDGDLKAELPLKRIWPVAAQEEE